MKKISYFLVLICITLIGCKLEATEETSYTDTNPDISINLNVKNGALPGKFTINDNGDKIQFSQGNLQYKTSTNVWRFAAQQYYYVGMSNANISFSDEDWIDLFGWGTANNPNNVSKDYSDYATYTEWGNNPITSGGNEANLWRTLTKDEWVYLFYGRANAATLFALGRVNGVNGTILLPDNWTLPAGASFTASTTQGLTDKGTYYYDENNGHFTDNTYTSAQWKTMEDNGAVFLPAAGFRYGTGVGSVGSYGGYWSSTPYGEYDAYGLNFGSGDLGPRGIGIRHGGRSVRLVR